MKKNNKRIMAHILSAVLLFQLLLNINVFSESIDKYEYEPGNFILGQDNTLSWKNPKSDKLTAVFAYMISDSGNETDVTNNLKAFDKNGNAVLSATPAALIYLENASNSDDKKCNVRIIFKFSDENIRNLIIGETYGTSAVFIQQSHSATPNPNEDGKYLNVDVYNGSAAAKASLSDTIFKSGKNSLKVESNNIKGSYFAVQFGGLNKNTTYNVSMQINTAEEAIYNFGGDNITLPNTFGEWETLNFEYNSANSSSFKIKPVGASREVYFDDITFTEKGNSSPHLIMGFETKNVSAPSELDEPSVLVGNGQVKLKWKSQSSSFLGYINIYEKNSANELLLRARLKRPGSSEIILSDLENDAEHTLVIKVQGSNNTWGYGLETEGFTVYATPHFYSEKFSIVKKMETQAEELSELVRRCEEKGLKPSYEIAEANVVKIFAKKVKRLYESFEYDEIEMYEPKVTEVYNETKAKLNDIIDGNAEALFVPEYNVSSNEIKNGSLISKSENGAEQQRVEIGYNAFYGDISDLEDMASVGVRGIQFNGNDTGPVSFVKYDEQKQDYVINTERAETAIAEFREEMDFCREHGIMVDIGTPMHYSEDVSSKAGASDYKSAGGSYDTFINFNPTSETAQKMIRKYFEIFMPVVYEYKDIVTSLTFVNEPYFEAYDKSYYYDKWTMYLKNKYGNISKLNAAYNSSYASFDNVKMPETIPGRDKNANAEYTTGLHMDYRLFVTDIMYEFFDFCITELDKYTNGEIPCGVKTMEFFREYTSRWTTSYARAISYDYEKVSKLFGFNGMDSFSYYMDSTGERSTSTTLSAKLSWYDFTTSVNDAPVFDTETHLAVDDADSKTAGCQMENTPILADFMAASAWMGAIHGCDLAAVWTWADPWQKTDMQNTVFTRRPDAMKKMSQTTLDARRLSDEINAFQTAKRNVAILYSYEDFMLNLQYQSNMFTAYNILVQKGQKPLYVTDKSIEKITDCQLLIIPGNLVANDNTVDSILNYISNGGKVIVIGENAFSRNEYNNSIENQTLKSKVTLLKSKATVISANLLNDTSRSDFSADASLKIESALKEVGLMNIRLVDKNTGETADVEWNAAEYNGEMLISACNYSDSSITVNVEKDGQIRKSVDDIKNNNHGLSEITLKPYVPVILKVPSSIESVSLLKATGAAATKIEKGKSFSAKLSVSNVDSNETVTANLIAAVYCDNVLVSAKMSKNIAAKKGEVKYAYISGITIPNDEKEYILKLMLWNGTDKFMPLAKPQIITE